MVEREEVDRVRRRTRPAGTAGQGRNRTSVTVVLTIAVILLTLPTLAAPLASFVSGISRGAGGPGALAPLSGAPAAGVEPRSSGLAVHPDLSPLSTGHLEASLNLLTNQLSAAQVTTPDCLRPGGLAFSTDKWNLYVTCTLSNFVQPLTSTGQPLTRPTGSAHGGTIVLHIPVGGSPIGIAYDPALGWFYVLWQAGFARGGGNGGLTIFSAQDNQVVGQLTLSHPTSLVYDGANLRIYVASSTGTIYEVDGTSLLASASLAGAAGDLQLAWDPGDLRVYVAGPSEVWALAPLTYPGEWTVQSFATAVSEPSGVAYDSANGLVYIVGVGGTSAVAVSHAPPVTNLSVGGASSAIAYDPTDEDLYETILSPSEVVALDPSTNTVIGSTAVCKGPDGVAFDGSNGDLYVTCATDKLEILAPGGLSPPTVVTTSVEPGSLLYDPVSGNVVVTVPNQNSLVLVNGTSSSVGGALNLPTGLTGGATLNLSGTLVQGTNGIAYDPGAGNLIVALGGSNNSSGGVTTVPANDSDDYVGLGGAILSTGNGSTSVAVNPLTGVVYAANSGSASLTLLNPNGSGLAIGGQIQLGSSTPDAVAVDTATGDVFVANGGSGTVSVVAGNLQAGGGVLATLAVGTQPDAIAYDSANGLLYVANGGSNTVSILNGSALAVNGSIPVGVAPSAIAFDSASERLYVANAGSNNVTVIDVSAGHRNAAVGTIRTGLRPTGVAVVVGPAGEEIYVGDERAGQLSIVPAAALFPINFSESGLPANTSWTVQIGSVVGTSLAGSVVFNATNGTETYLVSEVPAGPSQVLEPTVPRGTINVTGVPLPVAVQFSATTSFPVTFSEVGLPAGVAWGIDANGSLTNATLGLPRIGSEVVVNFLAGDPDFAIVTPSGYGVAQLTGPGILSQTQGHVTGPTHWTVHFGPLRPIEFVESNITRYQLFAGASWSVALRPAVPAGGPPGLNNGSDPTAVEFTVPVGAAYKYSILTPGSSYRAAPSAGTFRVPSLTSTPGVYTKTVKFILLTPSVVVKETGLPRATNWTFSARLMEESGIFYYFKHSSSGHSLLTVQLPPGNYSWAVAVPGYNSSPNSGTFTVAYPSAPITLNLTFAPVSAGCFFFTHNGSALGGPACNANANDLRVGFTQLPAAYVCTNQFLLGGVTDGPSQACPATSAGLANQLEVNWTASATGPVVSSCYWAVSGVPIGSCVVPSPAPNGFVLGLADITSVSWTVNGAVTGPPIAAPPGANGVEFFL